MSGKVSSKTKLSTESREYHEKTNKVRRGDRKISLKPHYTTGHRPSPVQHNEAGNSEFSTEPQLTLYRFRLEIEEKQTVTERGIKDKVILNLLVATVFFSLSFTNCLLCISIHCS